MKIGSNTEIPDRVFKFYSLEDYHVKAFLNHYLYLSHPSQLNDGMDACRDLLYLDSNSMTQEVYERLKKQIILKVPQLRTSRLSFESDSKNGYEALKEALYNVCFNFSGIVSFTDSKKSFFNSAMWAYYTNEEGFAIEFKPQKLLEGIMSNPINKQFVSLSYGKVKYKEELEALNVKDIHTIDEIGTAIVFQKQKYWENEAEWRMYIESDLYLNKDKAYGRYIHYPVEAIERICLGYKFWNKVSENRCNIKKDVWQYTVKNEYLPFVKKLLSLCNIVFMSTKCFGRTYIYMNKKIAREIPTPTRSFDYLCYSIEDNEITIEINEGKGISEYNEFSENYSK